MSTCRRKSDIAWRTGHFLPARYKNGASKFNKSTCKSMVQEDHFRKSQKPLQRPWHHRKQPRQPARPVGVAKIGLWHGRAEAERRPFSIRLL